MASNRNTVIQLKAMAKERGLKGCSRLRKADLINFINDARPIPAPRAMRPIPAPRTLAPKPTPEPRPNRIIAAINTYVKPTLVEIKKAFDWGKTSTLDIGSFITKNLNDLIGWAKTPSQRKEKPSLSDYVKEELKERSFEVKERISALRRFTTQYVIEGRTCYDPQSFMRYARQAVINLLRNNRRIKVKLIRRCNMEKISLSTGDAVNLLLIYYEERKHCCLIKSMSRLLSSQSSTDEHALHYCRRCLNHFATQEKLATHKECCSANEASKLKCQRRGRLFRLKTTTGACERHLSCTPTLSPS